MYKVERKPAEPKSLKYEVMLSPFKTLSEAESYVEKYKQFYPLDERNYTISKI